MTLDFTTWSRRSPVADWDFELPCPSMDRSEALAVTLAALLRALGSFAVAGPIQVTSASGGELAGVLAPGAEPERVASGLAAWPDAEDLTIPLDLLVTDPVSGATERLSEGATAWLTWETETERASPIRLLLSLGVDLYARRTWGEHRENTALAAANQPRLHAFLQRLAKDMGGVCHGVDAPGYRDQVGPLGFDPPGARG